MTNQIGKPEVSPHEGIWSSLLEEALHGSSRLSETKQIVLVGGPHSGKAAIARNVLGVGGKGKESEYDAYALRGGPSYLDNKGLGLAYEYVNVKVKEEDEAHIGVWTLGSDVSYGTLLPHALGGKADGNEGNTNLQNTLFMFVVDWSRPWLILPSLEKWVSVVEAQLDTVLGDDYETRVAMETALVDKFRLYRDPKGGMEAIEEELKTATIKRKVKRTPTNSLAAATQTPTKAKSPDPVQTVGSPKAGSKAPLGAQKLTQGALVNNLGLDMLVVATKVDVLNSNDTLTSEQADFILYKLRIFCLKYGMGLVNTSTTAKNNCDLLLSYTLHLLYNRQFMSTANVIDRGNIFVPRGWDTYPKIDVLAGNIKSMNPEESFEDVIKEPTLPNRTSPLPFRAIADSGDNRKTPAELEQSFLSRIRKGLEAAAEANKSSSTTTGAQALQSSHERDNAAERDGARRVSSNSTASGAATAEKNKDPAAFFATLMKQPLARSATPKH
ncbi:hypothetical protein SARC_02191 [Sphaeroforma arctica JP610]|uniref:Dynein light intermediate chain n=1 Tax=Sphaeroforma arctica JP610 TaxID=667725 RepID=A0A0L0GBK5_9EUKA|nr:hypothetical protein SARC_02191 [Sphaeroforma arctica JP610]KNC85618.1 hypothetical protein SARC_02191 [Sphaeroforma arctica JP610]|eukprot:XP_014159520.1 hypothetical protein SARC_02191 [Sphaeroforma arctica JP610]